MIRSVIFRMPVSMRSILPCVRARIALTFVHKQRLQFESKSIRTNDAARLLMTKTQRFACDCGKRSVPCASRGGWIHRQCNAVTKRRLQTFDCALLVSTNLLAAPSDADRADHLPIDNDRHATRVREEIKVCGLPRRIHRVVLE